MLKASGAAIAVPAKAGVGFDPAEALRAITCGGTRRAASASRCAPCRRRPESAPPRRGGRSSASRSCSRRRSRSRARAAPPASGRCGRLAPLLSATTYKHVIGVKYDPVKVGAALRPPLSTTCCAPKNAGWKVAGEHGRVLSSLSGVDLDARATALHLTRAGTRNGSARVAALALGVTQPELTTKAARALGATSVVGARDHEPRRLLGQPRLQRCAAREAVRRHDREAGSRCTRSTARWGQAHRRARLPRGPGDRERRARAVDRRRRLPAATTVFDAAFSAGTAVVHRVNHSFFISHYPTGLDATVADTGPDFTFRNDTEERDRDQGHGESRDDDGRLPLAPARPARSST